MSSALQVRDLAIGHGNRSLLSGINFDIGARESVALLGVNGSGKSTLLRTLAGLQPALTGEVRVEGVPIALLGAAQRARKVAVVLTGRPPTGQLDVETLVALGRQPWTGRWGTLTTDDRAQVDRALRLTGADHLRQKALHTCSDGECQKVIIARAIAQDTPLILLDEPTAFLDLPNRAAIVRMLRQVAHVEGKSVLFSTHDLQLALDLSDRLLLISDGALWTGTPAEALNTGTLERTFAGSGIRFDSGGTHRFEP